MPLTLRHYPSPPTSKPGLRRQATGYAQGMEFWPGDLVLLHGETACLVNMQGEAPVLESWLLASSNPSAPPLAERLADADPAQQPPLRRQRDDHPTDNVDEELLARPAKWDIRMIRRFMSFFGPISSVYDFLTFAVMLRVFHAGPVLFRSGWFVESLTTQTLVIFVIRTRRVPFYKSRPSRPLLATTLACAAFGVALPTSRRSPTCSASGHSRLPSSRS
jgi:hypothetical protein